MKTEHKHNKLQMTPVCTFKSPVPLKLVQTIPPIVNSTLSGEKVRHPTCTGLGWEHATFLHSSLMVLRLGFVTRTVLVTQGRMFQSLFSIKTIAASHTRSWERAQLG